jgi:hypothetical protein
LVETRALAGGAGKPVVEVDAFLVDAEVAEPVVLGAEVLGVGGTAGVADQGPEHDQSVTNSLLSLRINQYDLSETPLVEVTSASRVFASASVWGSAFATLLGDPA